MAQVRREHLNDTDTKAVAVMYTHDSSQPRAVCTIGFSIREDETELSEIEKRRFLSKKQAFSIIGISQTNRQEAYLKNVFAFRSERLSFPTIKQLKSCILSPT